MFEILRWKVVTAKTSDEAIFLARAYEFDAVLVDHVLHGSPMNGAELVRMLLDEGTIEPRKVVLTSVLDTIPERPFTVRFVRKPIEPRMVSIMFGKMVHPVPLVSAYVCGNGRQTLETIRTVKAIADEHHVEVEVIDLLEQDQRHIPETHITFTPMIVVHFQNQRWKFLPIKPSAVIACIENLTRRSRRSAS
jgi:hypothetical protein